MDSQSGAPPPPPPPGDYDRRGGRRDRDYDGPRDDRRDRPFRDDRYPPRDKYDDRRVNHRDDYDRERDSRPRSYRERDRGDFGYDRRDRDRDYGRDRERDRDYGRDRPYRDDRDRDLRDRRDRDRDRDYDRRDYDDRRRPRSFHPYGGNGGGRFDRRSGHVSNRLGNRRLTKSKVIKGNDEQRAASKILYVGNLPYVFVEDDVRHLFEKYGALASVSVPEDKYTKRNKGFAFVEFENRPEAEKALFAISGQEIEGRIIKIDWDIGREQKETVKVPASSEPASGNSENGWGSGAAAEDNFASENADSNTWGNEFNDNEATADVGFRGQESNDNFDGVDYSVENDEEN